jgi:HK97 family phage portal protein
VTWWDRWVWSRVQNREALTLEQLLAEEGRPTASGEPVTTDRALRLSTMFGCIRLIADSISTLPLHVYRGDDRDPITPPPLLQRPSADHPELADWLWAIVASLLTAGNAWGQITARAGAGMLPAQVDLLDAAHVAVTTDGEGRRVIRVHGKETDPADLFHVKAYPWPGQLEGLSPVRYFAETIALGIASEKYGARFFGDSGIPSGYLYSDQRIGDDRVKQLKAEWDKAHKGRRGTAVLSQVKYQNLSVAPEEAQFIQTQKLNAARICGIFGVPPGMLAGVELAGHEDYSSPEQRATDFLTFGLRPWLTRLERGISRQLLPSTQRARFNAGGLVRATLLDRYQAHESGIRAGWLLRSEVRELEDRPPVSGIDDQPAPGGAVA